jgi:thiamine transport system ATP-binding protein
MLTLDDLLLVQGDFRLSANFSFLPGITAVVGPSGSGKSTLLSAIGGFLSPREGRVLWKDDDITGKPPGDRLMSVVFQDNNLFPHLTIAENIGLGISPSLKLSSETQNKVDTAMDSVGLKGRGSDKPSQLSGGQQSRVALARTLIRKKPIALLDEPFSALGPGLKNEMLDLVSGPLMKVVETLVMITHDPEDALRIADQTVLVANGVAEPPVGTEALFTDPPQALKDYLG